MRHWIFNMSRPYKDQRFSIAVFDFGEYGYRDDASCLTYNELMEFINKHKAPEAEVEKEKFSVKKWIEVTKEWIND